MNSIHSAIMRNIALFVGAISLSACTATTAAPEESATAQDGSPPGTPLHTHGSGSEDTNATGGLHTETAHGGTGGGWSGVYCPNGTLTGIKGKYGNYVDRLDPICDHGVNSGYGVGGNGGERVFQHDCPNGSFITAIQGRSWTYVDALAIECRDSSGNVTAAWNVEGGGGGAWFDWDRCPSNMHIGWFQTKSASWLDQITPMCTPN